MVSCPQKPCNLKKKNRNDTSNNHWKRWHAASSSLAKKILWKYLCIIWKYLCILKKDWQGQDSCSQRDSASIVVGSLICTSPKMVHPFHAVIMAVSKSLRLGSKYRNSILAVQSPLQQHESKPAIMCHQATAVSGEKPGAQGSGSRMFCKCWSVGGKDRSWAGRESNGTC